MASAPTVAYNCNGVPKTSNAHWKHTAKWKVLSCANMNTSTSKDGEFAVHTICCVGELTTGLE